MYTTTELKRRRKDRNIKIYRMAYYLDMSAAYYSQIESGQRRIFYDTAVKISAVLDVTPDQLFIPKNDNS